MAANKNDLTPFVKLTGSIGAAEVLSHLYTTCKNGVYKPASTTALQHLVKLGYLSPDYSRGIVNVRLDKIEADLKTVQGVQQSC